MSITRRHVLAALAGSATVATLASGATVWSWWDRPAAEGRKALSADEVAFIEALAEAWMPPGGTPALSGAEAGLGAFMDDLIAAMPEGQGNELKLLINLLDDFTVPRRMARFQSLDLETRIATLSGWLDTPNHLLRSGVTALVALLASGYTMHPAIADKVNDWYLCGYGR